MKKLLVFILIASFLGCKNTNKKGVTNIKGNYIFFEDAAVLQSENEIYGVFCEKVGGVAIFAESGGIVVPVELFFTFVSEVVDGSVVVSHEVGEAVGEGEVGFFGVTEVPFSDDATTFVAGLCEKFGKGVFFSG